MTERLEPVYQRVAEGMRVKRLSAGLSQAKMAEVLNVPTNTYRNYETATNRIPLHTLIEVARYFKVSVNYFMEYGQDDGAAKNQIIIELKDTDVIHTLNEIQSLDSVGRKSVNEFIKFTAAKQGG